MCTMHSFINQFTLNIIVIDLVKAVTTAIHVIEHQGIDTSSFHEQVRRMYSWDNVAIRTENIYLRFRPSSPVPLMERLRRYYGCGRFAGKLFCLLVIVDYLFWCVLEVLVPAHVIDKCPRFRGSEEEEKGNRGKSGKKRK